MEIAIAMRRDLTRQIGNPRIMGDNHHRCRFFFNLAQFGQQDRRLGPADPLISFYDRGSSLTLLDTEIFTVDVQATLFTLV